MKVCKLIELLQRMDPQAEVYLMERPSWPFEYSIDGVANREEMESLREGDEPHPMRQEGTSPSDVFITEGTQVRYGSRRAWGVARR